MLSRVVNFKLYMRVLGIEKSKEIMKFGFRMMPLGLFYDPEHRFRTLAGVGRYRLSVLRHLQRKFNSSSFASSRY